MTVRRGLRWAALTVGVVGIFTVALMLWIVNGPSPMKSAGGTTLAQRSASLPLVVGPAPAAPGVGPSSNPIGKRVFEGACASCHAWTGAGAIISEAQLIGANDLSGVNVAQMILAGTGRPGGHVPYMPSFAASYTNTEIAAVANYVVVRFGLKPSDVDPADIAKIRVTQR